MCVFFARGSKVVEANSTPFNPGVAHTQCRSWLSTFCDIFLLSVLGFRKYPLWRIHFVWLKVVRGFQWILNSHVISNYNTQWCPEAWATKKISEQAKTKVKPRGTNLERPAPMLTFILWNTTEGPEISCSGDFLAIIFSLYILTLYRFSTIVHDLKTLFISFHANDEFIRAFLETGLRVPTMRQSSSTSTYGVMQRCGL